MNKVYIVTETIPTVLAYGVMRMEKGERQTLVVDRMVSSMVRSLRATRSGIEGRYRSGGMKGKGSSDVGSHEPAIFWRLRSLLATGFHSTMST